MSDPVQSETAENTGRKPFRPAGFVRRHFVVKTILLIALGVAAVGLVSIVHFSERYVERQHWTFAEELDTLRLIIERSYSEPLWNVHGELIQALNEAILSATPYQGIVIHDVDPSGGRRIHLATRKTLTRKRVGFLHSAAPLDFSDLETGKTEGILKHQDRVIGAYELFYTTEHIAESARENRRHLAVSFLAISLATVLALGALLNHFLIRRVLEIVSFARSVSGEGRYDRRLPPDSPDEIGVLAGSINGMLDQIERRDREKDEAERELRRSRSYLQSVFDAVPDALFVLEARTGRILDVNQAVCRLFACTREQVVGQGPWLFCQAPPYDAATARAWLDKSVAEGPQTFTWQAKRLDDTFFWADVLVCHSVIDGEDRCLVLGRDVSDRLQAEEERESLQAQLNQAQKMESIGRLAGGVAHDFNNMLGVILGFTELALDSVPPDQPLHAGLIEIRKAAERSADLTRQLLAFARKQTAAPKVLDLNDTIEGMLGMLRRLIGEDVHLAWRPGKTLPPVRIDPTQIDQILVNLCVNARDAISGTGEIAIETGTAVFRPEDRLRHGEFLPGDYVRMAVTDNGCGMDAETLSHLFEPFFTTKGVGQGTGLGLATLYGIVRQNGGFVHVYSEPGKGTTFTVYLPRHAEESAESPPEPAADVTAGGHETILLVEDDPALLGMTRTMLERQGYTVLTAASPGEAIRLARRHAGQVDLLMTDVIMPEMNGRDLARHLLGLHPGLKRLFMSGYTADVIAHHGVLNPDVHFIQKPFTMRELAAKLHEALERNRS